MGGAMNEMEILSSLFDEISQGLCIAGERGEIFYLNHEAERILGVSLEESKGKTTCDLCCGHLLLPDGTCFRDHCPLLAIPSSKSTCCKALYKNPLSTQGFLRIQCFDIFSSNLSTSPKKHLLLLEDISTEVALEQRKEDWRNMVAHDLRAPLSVILGALSIMPKEASDVLKQGHLIDVSKNAGYHMLDLLNLYMDVVRLDEGLMPVHLSCVSVFKIVQKVVCEMLPLASLNNISVEVNIPESLKIQADSELFFRVIQNLLTNAIKFSSSGKKIVILAAELPQEKIRISVVDQGIGISQEDILSIFNRFCQIRESKKRHLLGSGLGLTFCQQAVKLMGGSIGVLSTLGQGSEFFIVFPKSDCDSRKEDFCFNGKMMM